jgi:hypothetical protein
MKRILTCLLCFACSTPPPAPAGPDPEATRLAAQKLCYVFQYVDERCRPSEDLVEVGDATYRVAATIHHRMDIAGQAARGVRFEISLDGQPPTFGVDGLGKGLSSTDALDRAAQEWAALAGTAFVDAIRATGRADAVRASLAVAGRAPKGDGDPAVRAGPFLAYPGLSDFRGAPQGGPIVDHEGLIGALQSEVIALDASRPHSLLVIVKHDGSRFVCERGQIDGEDVGRVCEVAASFSWPPPVTPYAVRQFYVLSPTPEAPEQPAVD